MKGRLIESQRPITNSFPGNLDNQSDLLATVDRTGDILIAGVNIVIVGVINKSVRHGVASASHEVENFAVVLD